MLPLLLLLSASALRGFTALHASMPEGPIELVHAATLTDTVAATMLALSDKFKWDDDHFSYLEGDSKRGNCNDWTHHAVTMLLSAGVPHKNIRVQLGLNEDEGHIWPEVRLPAHEVESYFDQVVYYEPSATDPIDMQVMQEYHGVHPAGSKTSYWVTVDRNSDPSVPHQLGVVPRRVYQNVATVRIKRHPASPEVVTAYTWRSANRRRCNFEAVQAVLGTHPLHAEYLKTLAVYARDPTRHPSQIRMNAVFYLHRKYGGAREHCLYGS